MEGVKVSDSSCVCLNAFARLWSEYVLRNNRVRWSVYDDYFKRISLWASVILLNTKVSVPRIYSEFNRTARSPSVKPYTTLSRIYYVIRVILIRIREINQPGFFGKIIVARGICPNNNFDFFHINAISTQMCDSDELVVIEVVFINYKLTGRIRNVRRRLFDIVCDIKEKHRSCRR